MVDLAAQPYRLARQDGLSAEDICRDGSKLAAVEEVRILVNSGRDEMRARRYIKEARQILQIFIFITYRLIGAGYVIMDRCLWLTTVRKEISIRSCVSGLMAGPGILLIKRMIVFP